MPFENPLAAHFVKILLENYFTIKDTGFQTAEMESVLLMKNKNFVKLL